MYKTQGGGYGSVSYSVSSSVSYSSPSSVAPLGKKRMDSRCCGRGCKPCVADLPW